ncbi:DNA repair protein RecO [Hyphomicrobium nitrativorans NL23]|uniref:DNA repair protein RecO n=1 Tax=Hyphomicrobium nitrativorans NL23 TaxID=1029756 RepID=V5SF36_9HYPH|nr:DNA repair protein RecO [Hyphomicrobium nitrativorans]AHB49481.1 DNA repair protein RecO [Hyphomicrobium nitrativorans NL23]
MNWSDEGIVLSVRPHGETASVVELLTRAHGRHLGLVHGGRSRKARPVLQIGNHVAITWKARLADHLGHMQVELIRGYAATAMDEPAALSGLTSLTAMARLLPERDPHPNLYEVTLFVLAYLDDASVWPALLVRWELALIGELGFGLDLTECASTGANDGLIYVSPKSGRAVSASAGEPYRERLLSLPSFLLPGRKAPLAPGDIEAGFALTGHFLETRVLQPRGEELPEARARMLTYLGRMDEPLRTT